MKNKIEDLILYGLLALFILSLFHRLDFLHLKFEEPRRALVSWEMLRSGDWVHPSIYGLPYFNKPPVYNWVLAVFMKTFGTSDWVIRMPTIFSLLSIAGINFWYWRNKIGHQVALWSSLFFATSVNVYFYFSFQGEIDMFYTLIVFLQVLSIIHFFEKRQFWKLFLVSYFITAIGFLTKGVPSIGFQGLTLIGLMLYSRQYKWFFSLPHVVSGSLSVAVMSAFFYYYHLSGGQADLYLSKIFFEGARRTVNHQASFSFLKTFLSFVPLMVYLLSPWVLLSLFGFDQKVLAKQLKNPWLLYALVFLVFNVPLYWFSAGTRDRYLYMFLPFFMVWFAPWFLNGQNKNSLRITTTAFTVIIGSALIVLLFTLSDSTLFSKLIVGASGAFLIVIAWLTFRIRFNPFLSWFSLLIALRFTFNIVVLEVRKEEEKSAQLPDIVQSIHQITGGQQVFYFAPFVPEEVSLPLVDATVVFNEVSRLDYTFTYYLNRALNQTVLHTDVYPKEGFIIQEVTLNTDNKTNQVLLEFQLGQKQYELVNMQ